MKDQHIKVKISWLLVVYAVAELYDQDLVWARIDNAARGTLTSDSDSGVVGMYPNAASRASRSLIPTGDGDHRSTV
jgi:hypothetical protein